MTDYGGTPERFTSGLARLVFVLGCIIAAALFVGMSDPHATSTTSAAGATVQEYDHSTPTSDVAGDFLTSASDLDSGLLVSCLLLAVCCLALLARRLQLGRRRDETSRPDPPRRRLTLAAVGLPFTPALSILRLSISRT